MQGNDSTEEAKANSNYDIDIATLKDEGGELKAVPALRSAVSMVAAKMSIFALQFLQSGKLEQQIHMMACNDWEGMLVVQEDFPPLGSLVDFVANQRHFGLVPDMKIEKGENDTKNILIQHGTMSLMLERWNNCPLHKPAIFNP